MTWSKSSLYPPGDLAACALYTVGLICWGNAKAWLLEPTPSGSIVGVVAGLVLTAIVTVVALVRRLDWATLGLRGSWWPSVRTGIAVGLLGGLLLAIVYAVGSASGNASLRAEESTDTGALLLRVLVLLPFDTTIPEELAFRGVLLGWLSRRGRPVVAVLITSLPFVAWHVGISQRETGVVFNMELAVKLMGDGIGGFIFGLVRVRTGQLAGATAAHWLLDGVLMLAIRVLGLVRTTT